MSCKRSGAQQQAGGDAPPGTLERAVVEDAALASQIDLVADAIDGLVSVHVGEAQRRLGDSLTRLRERVAAVAASIESALELAAGEVSGLRRELEADASGAASVPAPPGPTRHDVDPPIRLKVGPAHAKRPAGMASDPFLRRYEGEM